MRWLFNYVNILFENHYYLMYVYSSSDFLHDCIIKIKQCNFILKFISRGLEVGWFVYY